MTNWTKVGNSVLPTATYVGQTQMKRNMFEEYKDGTSNSSILT